VTWFLMPILLLALAFYAAVRMERAIEEEHRRMVAGEPPRGRKVVKLHRKPKRGKHRRR
jgi:hypothetical protein